MDQWPGQFTRKRIFLILKVLELRRWSARRPGVAMTTCGFRESSRAWATMSAGRGQEVGLGGWSEAAGTQHSEPPGGPRTHATNDDAVLQAQRLPQDPELLCDLVGQLPGGVKEPGWVRWLLCLPHISTSTPVAS